MELGKNIKKQKLIPTPSKAKKDQQVTEDQGQGASGTLVNLENYLTKEAFEKRTNLKKKFDADIARLRGSNVQLIVFSVGKEQYAFEILKTREVIPTPHISELPHTADHIVGVSKVRDAMILMLDLEKRFGIDRVGEELPNFTLVIEHATYKIGLLISDVPKTLKIDGGDINPATHILSDTTRDETYIKGVISRDDEIIFLLDIEEFVEGNKIQLLPESLASK